MNPIFLCGALLSPELLSTVLGQNEKRKLQPMTLPNHRLGLDDATKFHSLHASHGQTVTGQLFLGLDETETDRLTYYAKVYGSDSRTVSLATSNSAVEVTAFIGTEAGTGTLEAWQQDVWNVEWAPVTRQAAREIMDGFGVHAPEILASRLPQILQRAASYVRANTKVIPSKFRSEFDRSDVAMKTFRRPYSNFFTVEEHDVSFKQYSGQQSETVNRAAFVGGDAVVVLPYDPVRDTVLIIGQFRFGPYVRGDNRPWSLEPIAGRIDLGETPEKAARREANEEAGLTVTELRKIANYYSSPGVFSEYLYSFLAITDLPNATAGINGLAEEAEDIESHVIKFTDLMDLISSGEVEDAQLILAAHWLAGQRDLIRQNA